MNADQEKARTYHGDTEKKKKNCYKKNLLKHGGTEVAEENRLLEKCAI